MGTLKTIICDFGPELNGVLALLFIATHASRPNNPQVRTWLLIAEGAVIGLVLMIQITHL